MKKKDTTTIRIDRSGRKLLILLYFQATCTLENEGKTLQKRVYTPA